VPGPEEEHLRSRDEGLRMLKKPKKRSRVGSSVTDGTRLRATHPNHAFSVFELAD